MRNTAPDLSAHELVEPVLLHVAVGVITNLRGQVLIARRPEHLHQGGLWEFPGGKLEPGETVRDALCRELREELAIEVRRAEPMLSVRHAYPDRRVLLDVWRVNEFTGEPHGAENQKLCWVEPDHLEQYRFPAANKPIVAAARLPNRYAILDLADDAAEFMLARLQGFSRAGLRLVQLRAKSLSDETVLRLARLAVEFCGAHDMTLLLNATPELVHQSCADGIHLTTQRARALVSRPLGDTSWVAVSCHSVEDLRHAERIGADFAVLGPVAATATHPDALPLGWERFRACVAEVNLPVFALGGMNPMHIPEALRRGAQGIAGIRDIAGRVADIE